MIYVYTLGGDSIDEILVCEGLAKAGTRDGQHKDLLVVTLATLQIETSVNKAQSTVN